MSEDVFKKYETSIQASEWREASIGDTKLEKKQVGYKFCSLKVWFI